MSAPYALHMSKGYQGTDGLPVHLARLRRELQLEEIRLTKAIRALDATMERIENARLSYTRAVIEFITARAVRKAS